MDHEGVLIYAEVRDGAVTTMSAELVSIGARLAGELGEPLSAILAGHGVNSYALELIYLGVGKVHVVDLPTLAEYRVEAYVSAVVQVCKAVCPNVLLFGHTAVGRDIAPRVAFRLKTGVAMDCVKLEPDPSSGRVLMTRQVFGGNAQSTLVIDNAQPQVATVRARIQESAERDPSRQGEIVYFPVQLDPSPPGVIVVERQATESTGDQLEEASVVVVGGRGMGGAEGFKALDELARALGGVVGASRAPVNAGWISSELQIGISGTTVGPEMYIAVGVSGSVQHMVGCLAARNIIAINKDPEAPIFRLADFGAVGDWRQIAPAFTEKCRSLLLE